MSILFQNLDFKEILKKLDFSLESDIKFPEIIFIDNIPNNLHPKHYIALEFAEILEATAVYFKYYDDNRFCVPQVYFYDNSSGIYDKNKIAEIHRNVYSSSQVALICVIDKISVSLFDTRKPIQVTHDEITNRESIIKKSYLFEELDVLSKYFNAKKLNSGDFWGSDEASDHFKNNKSVYEELVRVLSLIRKDFHKIFQSFSEFQNDTTLAINFADEILFKCILIKYLEENGLEFAQQFYKDNKISQNSLNEVLESGQIIQLLDALEFHFNGNVFIIEDDKRKILSQLNLSDLALCLDGKYGSNRTGYLWEMYSFKHIPIELISNFYEEFIPKDKENSGTVYTPSHLVNLLIDECLPLSINPEHLNYNIRLADVSCGSGIFITTAFKRLIQRLRIGKWINAGKPNELPQPTLEEVKVVLSNNIFGIDKNDTATKLAKFSLQLAICQLVPKKELWTWNENRVFKDLQDQNIFSSDFFDFLVEEKSFHNSLDLIIGNPPFQSLKEDKVNKEYSSVAKKLKAKLGFEFSVKIPDNQLALMFLEASSLLLKPKGDLCFIQKSTSLLYNNGAKEFRNSLFNQFYVHQIIDFTLLKNDLFKSKGKEIIVNGKPKLDKNGKPVKGKPTSVESCAVFYKNETKEEGYITNHIVSRLLKTTKDGLSFEFDYYDFYEISRETVIKDDTIWRCNLLGGNRLNHLVKKLNQKNKIQTNLEDYILNHIGIDDESYCEGFIKGTPQGEKDGKNFHCEYIVNKEIITAKNFEKNIFDSLPFDQKFYRAPQEKVFKKPLIAIKEQISNGKSFVRFYTNDKAFDSRIVGISFSDIENGLEIGNKLHVVLQKNEKINALKTLATCSQFFLGSSSVIQKADINNWTIPLNTDEIMLSESEKIIANDVLDFIYPSWYLGENAEINKRKVSKDELIQFGTLFNQEFNAIYKKENKEQKLASIFEGTTFFALEFEYSERKISEPKLIDKTEADKQIEKLIISQNGKNVLVNKVLRIYSPNKITLIKPKKLRFWLKSIALQDSDEVFDDIIENGLK